ncbi:hypothetical protein Tco_1180523, partial [Tanacetum coccineum]
LAMRESCKCSEDKLGVKVDKLGKETLVNSTKTSMSLKVLATHADFLANLIEVGKYIDKAKARFTEDTFGSTESQALLDNSLDECSDVGIREIHPIVEDTVDRLVPFKYKLDLYRLELSDLLAQAEVNVLVLIRINKKDTLCLMLGVTEPACVVIKVPRYSKNKGTGSHSRWKTMDEFIQNEVESSK